MVQGTDGEAGKVEAGKGEAVEAAGAVGTGSQEVCRTHQGLASAQWLDSERNRVEAVGGKRRGRKHGVLQVGATAGHSRVQLQRANSNNACMTTRLRKQRREKRSCARRRTK